MSIGSMVKVAYARRRVNADARRRVGGDNTEVPQTPDQPETSPSNSVGDAMDIVTTYVPTEIIAIYTAVITALGPDRTFLAAWIAFWLFQVMTPLVVWLVYAGKVRAVDPGAELPIKFAQWPKFEMLAATVIFFAWAYSMPGSPFVQFKDYYNVALAALVLPGSAAFLGLLAPVMKKPLEN